MIDSKIWNAVRPLFFLFLFWAVLQSEPVIAGEFDNAYTFYTKHGAGGEPAYLNKNDGYVYFCSWGSKSETSTKYRTVGYTITIEASGYSDSVEVKLGGSIVKNVSSVTKNNITYVLRKAKLNRIQELFFGDSHITWKQIFRKTNTYKFDAIMTVVEGGKELCGIVTENSNKRRLSAEREAYLYRTLSGIKSARAWKNADDLDNFYGRKVRMPPVSPLMVEPMNIGGSNIYYNDGKWYIKKDSVFRLGINSRFDDAEAVGSRYHPNYNVYKFSGWGDNQKYYVSQGLGGSDGGRAGVLKNGNSGAVTYKGIDYSATTTYRTNPVYFTSTLEYYMSASDGGTVYAVPEGRVYYNNLYPHSGDEDDNLCDKQSNAGGMLTLVSDDSAPVIECPPNIQGFTGMSCALPVSVCDSYSGINVIRVFRNDGVMVFEKNMPSHTNNYSLSSECKIRTYSGESYCVYAMDNVGNERYSEWIKVAVPRAHTVKASISGGYKEYNKSIIHVDVFGGNSEISSLVIMSEDGSNVSGERLILANKSVEANTLEPGLFEYSYRIDVMEQIRNLPDGKYIFDVISGGRYETSQAVRLAMVKDVTPPKITCNGANKTACGWFCGRAAVTVSAQDNLSGIQSFRCICNNEITEGQRKYDTVNNKEIMNFSIYQEGENRVVLSAADNAGNTAEHTEIIRVDASAPTYTLFGGLEGTDVNDGKWIGRKQLDGGIILNDRYSGFIAAKRYEPILINSDSGLCIFPEQNYEVIQKEYDNAVIKFSGYYKDNVKTSKNLFVIDVKDRAGNRLKQKLYVNVDCDAPKLTYPADNPWDKETFCGNIDLSDIHSGIRSVQVKRDNVLCGSYSFDASQSERLYLDFSEYADVTDSVSVTVTDAVGNAEEYFLECSDARKRERMLRSIRTRLR